MTGAARGMGAVGPGCLEEKGRRSGDTAGGQHWLCRSLRAVEWGEPAHTEFKEGCEWAGEKKKNQKTKSLQTTQVVWERSVQAERPEAKQSHINYLLQTEGNFRVNWAADICPVLATNTLLRRMLSPAPCYPCWNLLPPHYWQPDSSLIPPWHIVLINPLW